MPRRRSKLFAVVVLVAATIGLSAVTAAAHVTIQPPTAAQGASDVSLSFRVPNEVDSADTTQLEVQFPTDHPVASVSVQPKDGWTYKVTTTKLPQPIQTDDGQVTDVVADILWTGGTIKPGEFDDFTVAVGSLPADATSLEFKALQTYSNGDVVRWIEDTPPGGPEPQNPAPVLTLTKEATAGGAAGSSGAGDDGTARTLGIIGIVVGALGVAFGAVAVIRSRRHPSTT